MEEKGYWVTNSAKIKMDNIDNQLYINDSVKDFLENKCFIIAEKGIGKTLLLKKKKYDLLKSKNNSGLFIPSYTELDIPTDFNSITKNQIALLEENVNTKIIWTISIQLSAIKKFYYTSSEISNEEKNKIPDLYLQIFVSEKEYCTPSEIFHYLIKEIPKVLQYNAKYSSYLYALYRQIHSNIYIFIDRLDHAMLITETEVSEKMWKAMQIGLLEAAWDLQEHCTHIKIFCSIRKEAYLDYQSPIKGNLEGEICFLNYSETELHELINKLADYYEGKGKTIENIVGLDTNGTFIHSKTGNEETVFKYMLRHTVEKPRDLIRIASTLKKRINLENDELKRIDELRDTTNETAEKIATDIFSEKTRFLDCLRDKNDRELFLALIPKNVLNQDAINSICRKFNNKKKDKCNKIQCNKNKNNGGCKHPFCELYNIGLFGYVRQDKPQKQIFKDPDKAIVNHLIGRYSYYVVHPSLCEIIKKLRPDHEGIKYTITPGITTGNGYKWDSREEKISDLIDVVLNAELPENEEKKIIQYLKDTIKITGDIKTLHKQTMDKIHSIKKTIFLSYCGKDEVFVNKIDKKLQNLGINVTRDNRDLLFKQDVVKFMKSLKQHDYVITIISDSYLKSTNCMFEIGELLKIKNYQNKTLQIILPDAEIFNDEKKFKYISYWKEKKDELEKNWREHLSVENSELISEDIKHYDDIINNLPKFLQFVRGEKGMLYKDLQKNGYNVLLEHINSGIKNKPDSPL
ncbi:MAG: toll/interleukin-1 receptor domain-containing protein [Paludibacter sp.]|nr:toll/interleukin-1 receptor domain-containing protein [Paludibacter sp.]